MKLSRLISLFIFSTCLLGCNPSDLKLEYSAISLDAPATMLVGHCTSWEIDLYNLAPNANSYTAKVRVHSDGIAVEGASVYADSSCTMPVTSFRVTRGSNKKTVYLKYNFIKKLTLEVTSTAFSKRYTASIMTSMDFKKVELVAGGRENFGVWEGTGANVRLPEFRSIVSDGTYIYVLSNSVILKIDPVAKTMNVLAGQYYTYGAVDGPGPSARFNWAWDMTYHNGYLYVADYNNHAIRQVDPNTGNVTTVAGLLGTGGSTDDIGVNARFSWPHGITTDGTYLYVSDSVGRRIRRIDPANSFTVTFLVGASSSGMVNGTGTAVRFNVGKGMVSDGTYLYIADQNNHLIRRLELSNNQVTTLAGVSGTAGHVDGAAASARFNQPRGVALHGGFLYVADTMNYRIRKIDLATSIVSTVVGDGTDEVTTGAFATARIGLVERVAVHGNQLVFGGTYALSVADLVSETVTMPLGSYVDSSSKSATVDGVGAAVRFNWVDHLTSDGNFIYVPDCNGNVIRRVSIATQEVVTLAGTVNVSGSSDGIGMAATMSCPSGIAYKANNIYFTDYGNSLIRKLDLTTLQVTTLAGSPGVTGGADGIGSAATFDFPSGLSFHGDDLIVVDYNGHIVRRVNPTTGAVTTIAGLYGASGTADGVGAAARFNGLYASVTVDDMLYVLEYGNHTLRKINVDTGEVSTVAGVAGTMGFSNGSVGVSLMRSPYSLTTDGDVIYISDYSNNSVRKFDPITGELSTVFGNPARSSDRNGSVESYSPPGVSGIVWTPSGLFFTPGGLNISWLH